MDRTAMCGHPEPADPLVGADDLKIRRFQHHALFRVNTGFHNLPRAQASRFLADGSHPQQLDSGRAQTCAHIKVQRSQKGRQRPLGVARSSPIQAPFLLTKHKWIPLETVHPHRIQMGLEHQPFGGIRHGEIRNQVRSAGDDLQAFRIKATPGKLLFQRIHHAAFAGMFGVVRKVGIYARN
jgi:hypothetical protein